ncbi:MAG: T9SS type A sorting domain-containing protein [Flavobacteriia bacterium]|nr:T9SS type A sorting domain-containing protein [Flavobacteriia bacterium]
MKLKYTLFILSISILSLKTFSQIKNLGTPFTFKEKIVKTKEFYSTPEVKASEQIALDELENQNSNLKMYRFGKEFNVSIDILNQASKTTLPNGDFLYQYGISCKNALSINVIFDAFKLADGVILYLADVDGKSYDGAYTSLNNNASNVLGTALVNSSKIIIEVYVPKSKVGQSIIHLGTIIHGYRDLDQYAKSLNSSGSCEIDVNCPLGSGWENQRNSVAMMVNGGGFCTGSLVNNTSGTIIPYFLSANHCGTNPASWVFRFRWESPAGQVDCATSAPSVDGPSTMNVNGGTLKANSANSDFTLTLLNTAPDPAWGIYYNGWDHSGIAASQLTGIHHPAGDIKKISRDDDGAVESTWSGTPANSHWRVPSWDQGVTEGGSSGSPLFDQNHRTIGQLHGGASQCGNSAGNLWDDYGKFAVSWDGEGTDATRLSTWLDPSNLGSIFIDGVDPTGAVITLDAGLSTPQGVEGNFCGITEVFPQITLLNSGSDTLISATITYGFDGVNTLVYNWIGSLALYQTQIINLPSITLSGGNHTFNAIVSSPNVGTDENNNNDNISSSFTIVTNGETDTLNLTLDQYGSETTWQLLNTTQTVLYSGGPYSDSTNCVTTLVKIPFCLVYGCYDFVINDSYGDGLSTTNCAGNYTITRPDNSIAIQLQTVNSNFGTTLTTNFCIANDLALTELSNSDLFTVYPNPTSSEITIDTKNISPFKIEVLSLVGQAVYTTINPSNLTKVDVSNFSKGMYLVKITSITGVVLKEVFVK